MVYYACIHTRKQTLLFIFEGWGCHTSNYTVPYITVAAAIGSTKKDVDRFIEKFQAVLEKFNKTDLS